MSKTDKTLQLEKLLKQKLDKYGKEYYVFECTLGWNGKEIVDCVSYNCDRVITCYEIKQSVNDFHSNNKLSFFGHKNYFVMPYSLYEKVKNEIPYDVGCYVAIDHMEHKEKEEIINEYGTKRKIMWAEPVDGMKELYCIKTADKRELRADKEIILSSMLRSLKNDTNRAINKPFYQDIYHLCEEYLNKGNTAPTLEGCLILIEDIIKKHLY